MSLLPSATAAIVVILTSIARATSIERTLLSFRIDCSSFLFVPARFEHAGYILFLALHGANHNAFDKVTLEVGVNQQNGEYDDHRDGHTYGKRCLLGGKVRN